MSSKNIINVLGHVGADPEITTMQNGQLVANFSVATSDTWKDKDSGEKKSRTQWHRIVVFNQNLVDVCEKYVRKGDQIDIQGSMEYRTYEDNEGIKRSVAEIVLRAFDGKITLLGKAKESEEGKPQGRSQANEPQADTRRGYQQPARQSGAPTPRR